MSTPAVEVSPRGLIAERAWLAAAFPTLTAGGSHHDAKADTLRAQDAQTHPRARGQRWTSRLRADTALAQFTRFVLVGGGSNAVYIPLFLLLRAEGVLQANVVGVLASTVLASELHRRLTFGAADRVRWFTAQWEAGGIALVGLLISSLVLAGAGLWAPTLDGAWQLGMVFAVTGAIGILRFLALRGWVFQIRSAPQNPQS